MEKLKGVPKKTIALFLAVTVLASGLIGLSTYIMGFGEGLNIGLRQGQLALLENIRRQLGDSNLKVEYTETPTGLNISVVYVPTGLTVWSSLMRWDCYIYKNGEFVYHHPMTIVNNGKDWITTRIFEDDTHKALYICVSNSTSSVSASWTDIPSEITLCGLGRALGTYTDTGTGTGNVTKLFQATAPCTTCLYAVNFGATVSGGTLVVAEQQSPTVISLVQNDNLTVTMMYACTS
jgi:hypothetical protein